MAGITAAGKKAMSKAKRVVLNRMLVFLHPDSANRDRNVSSPAKCGDAKCGDDAKCGAKCGDRREWHHCFLPSGSISYSYDNNDRLTTDTYDTDGNTISSAGTASTYDFETACSRTGR